MLLEGLGVIFDLKAIAKLRHEVRSDGLRVSDRVRPFALPSVHDPVSSALLCRTTGAASQLEKEAPPRLPTGPAAMSTANKKRPRLDLTVEGARERKRGKSMFGILLGTLNKAKIEDKERNASEAVRISPFFRPLKLSHLQKC